MSQQALPPFLREASINRQQWAAQSHPHPYNTALWKEAAINWHTAHSTLAITLLSLARPGSKSREAEVLLVLKAEQYPDNVWLGLPSGCNIYHRGERQCQRDGDLPTWERYRRREREECRATGLEESAPTAEARPAESTSGRRQETKQNRQLSEEKGCSENAIYATMLGTVRGWKAASAHKFESSHIQAALMFACGASAFPSHWNSPAN